MNPDYNCVMRRLLAGFLYAVPLLVAADPFTDICDQQLPPAGAQVHTRVADPAISFALRAGEIRGLSGVALPGVSLGLTRVEHGTEQQVSLSRLTSSLDGRVCARPRIDLTLVLHRVDIYVASELAGNDCLVSAVWQHELRHFAIWQETLSNAASELERLMQRHYDGAVLVGSDAEIGAELERDLRGRWAREIDVLLARGDVEHELLDGRDALSHSQWCEGALTREPR